MTPAALSLRSIIAARGVLVTLSRGGRSAENVAAVVGESEFETIIDGEAVTPHTTTDFLIEANDYDFGDGVVEPERLDCVCWGDRKYEARSPGGGRVFDYSDSDRSVLRLRTSQVK
jgi:hypothetical protein